MANLENASATDLTQQTIVPEFQSLMNVQTGPGMNALQLPGQLQNQNFQQNIDASNFNRQADLAQRLADSSKPSGFQSGIGQASSILGGAGSAAGGVGSAMSATKSYICREMVQRGLLCDQDFENFYLHLFPAIFFKGRAFWNYYLNGQKLVDIANDVWPSWPYEMKQLLFDRVMAEKNPVKAVQLYAEGLRMLTRQVAPHLWDERNMKVSRLDSLRFLPLLFACKAYRDNFWRIVRIKCAMVYDKPPCMHQIGSR